MSGGGVGGGGAGGQTDDMESLDCGELIGTTSLTSPHPEVLKEISEDDLLPLELQDNDSVAAIAASGRIAGTITFAHLPRLIDCMKDGHSYVARVLSIEGGACNVQVRPEPRS